MLVVTDNGVQLLLKPKTNLKIAWQDRLAMAILFAINALLSFGLHLYSVGISIFITVVIIMISFVLEAYRKRNQPVSLSGGDLVLSPNAFKHTFLGKTTQYQLDQHDKIEKHGDSLKICNGQNKTLYQIKGFSESKHLEVAQAVLEGKQIKTQAKAIKMQSNV